MWYFSLHGLEFAALNLHGCMRNCSCSCSTNSVGKRVIMMCWKIIVCGDWKYWSWEVHAWLSNYNEQVIWLHPMLLFIVPLESTHNISYPWHVAIVNLYYLSGIQRKNMAAFHTFQFSWGNSIWRGNSLFISWNKEEF